MDFHYLITVIIRKGSPKIFELLKEIFEPFGIVADKDIIEGILHHMITVLIITTRRSFEPYMKVLLEESRSIYIDFEFIEGHLCCSICFALEHSSRMCTVNLRRFVPTNHTDQLRLPKAPQRQ